MTDEKFLELLLIKACKNLSVKELTEFMKLLSKISGVETIGVNHEELKRFKACHS